jgi:hypothetical protein
VSLWGIDCVVGTSLLYIGRLNGKDISRGGGVDGEVNLNHLHTTHGIQVEARDGVPMDLEHDIKQPNLDYRPALSLGTPSAIATIAPVQR